MIWVMKTIILYKHSVEDHGMPNTISWFENYSAKLLLPRQKVYKMTSIIVLNLLFAI